MGFESQYDNGIERSILWERDIAIDLKNITLPLQVDMTLIMTLEKETEIIRFPVSEMTIDDLHFVKPCSKDIQVSIERRGLDEISNKLIRSYNLQLMNDRSGIYPLVTFLQKYKPEVYRSSYLLSNIY